MTKMVAYFRCEKLHGSVLRTFVDFIRFLLQLVWYLNGDNKLTLVAGSITPGGRFGLFMYDFVAPLVPLRAVEAASGPVVHHDVASSRVPNFQHFGRLRNVVFTVSGDL